MWSMAASHNADGRNTVLAARQQGLLTWPEGEIADGCEALRQLRRVLHQALGASPLQPVQPHHAPWYPAQPIEQEPAITDDTHRHWQAPACSQADFLGALLIIEYFCR